jgi:hypothetical protein
MSAHRRSQLDADQAAIADLTAGMRALAAASRVRDQPLRLFDTSSCTDRNCRCGGCCR